MQLNASSKALIGAVLVLIASFAFVSVVTDDSDADTLCSVTLNGNGGTSSDGSSKSYSVISGQGFVLPSNTFAKSGYILIGWSSSSSGAVQWHPGQEMTVSSNKTVNAVWQDLTYDGVIRLGGASKGDSFEAPVIQSAIGGVVDLPLSDDTAYVLMKEVVNRSSIKYTLSVSHCGTVKSSEATRAGTTISADWLTLDISNGGGFTFSGSPTGNGVYAIDVSMKTKGLGGSLGDLDDLLLRWYVVVPVSADSQPVLVFDMDGGSGSVGPMTGPAGTAVVLPSYTDGSGDQISKRGYTLVGWEIPDGRGSRSVYALGSLYTMAFDAVVKAKWVSDPNVLVYSLDGGSLANVQAYVVHDGSSVTLRDSGVSKTGYIFIGWRPMQDHQISYAPGLTIESFGSYYMEAYFVPEGTILSTVTFDPNGGQGTVFSQQVEPGMYVKLPTDLCMVRDGYSFVGWSESSDGDVIGYEDHLIEGDITLYAVWQRNSSPDPGPDEPDPMPVYYDVSFSTNQGMGNYPVQRIQSGGYAIRPADPVREGHVFLGWRSITQSDLWDFRADRVLTDTILQAQWAEHFSFEVDGAKVTVQLKGDYRDMAFDIDWGDIDGAVSEAFGPSVGTAEHTYRCDSYGFITVRSHDSKGDYESRMTYSVEGEHYNPPLVHTVTFDPGNGDPSYRQTVEVGSAVIRPSDPVWEGHSFTGWYSEGSKWDFSTVVTRDMVLTGGWDDIVPEKPTRIAPIASFSVSRTSDGWHLDASGSTNAVSYSWLLDGKVLGSGKEIDVDLDGLSVGTHFVRLVVYSSTGDSDSSTRQIVVQSSEDRPDPSPGDDEGKSWLEENWLIVSAILLLVLIMAVRFWI